MDTIKAIIVDDEKNNRITLLKLIEKFCPQVNVIAECDSVDSAIKAIDSAPTDAVFLDVEMPSILRYPFLQSFFYRLLNCLWK